MSRPTPSFVTALVALLWLGGCMSVQKQLESVARDWCMTIRASQVIPVYPLTEDLQPGDVFLVTVPVHDQVALYKARGFLPLDQHIKRLHGFDYKGYYRDEYWSGDFASVPHPRMVRSVPKDPNSQFASLDPNGLLRAPRAAFPTYSFKVDKDKGAKLAIPVQGVPLALGFMSSTSAVGTVTISDAYTYAAPTEELFNKTTVWAADPGRKAVLSQLKAKNPKTDLFLRVVQRVYLTGGVVVSVTNEKSSGFGGDADLSTLGEGKAASKTSGQPSSSDPNTSNNSSNDPNAATQGKDSSAGNNLQEMNKALNEALSDKTPGASLKILQTSSRSVSLKENFDRPLVIGYLGFDFPILDGGNLGVPIATVDQLEKRGTSITRPLLGTEKSAAEAEIVSIFDHFTELAESDQQADQDRATQFVISVAKQIDDPEINRFGNTVASGALRPVGAVSALNSKLNFYLAKKESAGVGGIHSMVVSILTDTASEQE